MPNELSRKEIALSASRKLKQSIPSLKKRKAFLGLDGFVDSIIDVVAVRQSPSKYTPTDSISVLGDKISAASGKSANFELVCKLQKLGGNGPIMANALANAGLSINYVGMLGYPKIHPVFLPLSKTANALSIADPGFTDALEFADGKVMLGKYAAVNDVNWNNLVSKIPLNKLKKMIDESALVGFVNWTMLPYMTQLWDSLHKKILKGKSKNKLFFADLCDPAKRANSDTLKAMKTLSAMQKDIQVILGLNLSEAVQIAKVIGLKSYKTPEKSIEQMAKDIRAKLKLHCVVVHPRTGAAAATETHSASFIGPFVKKPKLSTGAGDNFNAGFCLGQLLGLSLEESLATAVGTSGYYVRNAASPTAPQLAKFLANLPNPE